ncbi:YacL family protein [Dongshaea marina]|uniref:UPF0231 family protein n=1 Tax=Dongshaea marina TaxID=2047966 RepID=UPI000D3E6793|nr:YacL family protein [Dongshaea marina]
MDYEFRRFSLDGSYRAFFSMGHEALGRWLIEELGDNISQLEALLKKITEIRDSNREWLYSGKQLNLLLSGDEALVQANAIAADSEELEQDLDFYDDEQVSVCGLEDFEKMLQSWSQFVLND